MTKQKVLVVKHKLDFTEAAIKTLALSRALMATYGTFLIVKTIVKYTRNGQGLFEGMLDDLTKVNDTLDEVIEKNNNHVEEIKIKLEGE